MTPENLTEVVTEAGYVPMSDSQIDENIEAWESAGS